jgi:thioesterase DpgC
MAAPLGDSTRLRDIDAETDALLSSLPRKGERSPDEHRRVARLLDEGRRLRARFMHDHAEAVYAALTDDGCHYHRLPELIAAAAERFPGLVPTSAQLDAERARPLAEQEGREIDQGIFTRGVLRAERAGRHLVEAMLRPTARATELFDTFQAHGTVDLGAVAIERRGVAAHVTMQNRDCLNAEDTRLVGDLETAIDLALLDERIRVGVLRGGVMTHRKYDGKRVFCAGINLKALNAGQIPLVEFLLVRELGLVNKLRNGLSAPPDLDALGLGNQKPWVAAVDAFAIGGGMQLLLVMDRVIAADDAYFSLPAAHEGIVPGAANLRITRHLGSRIARALVLAGEKLPATDSRARLICDEVVAPEDMDAAVDAAVRLLEGPAVIGNRRLLNLAEEPPDAFRLFIAEFAVVQALRLHGGDVAATTARFSMPGREG